ncbi:hypothetical protein [Methanosphaera sp. BMS]|uniref:hypothetical protein n=1 Tax=Methanosphaera sp. BMS TaxID=1789762 RepID=UPI0013A6DAD2|nr:hypothetical protein [Methanosphaera sp. BMS]
MIDYDLEILNYIDNSDFEENMKIFLKSAITYELFEEPRHYKNKYDKLIENAIEE